jgi:type III secretion protein S
MNTLFFDPLFQCFLTVSVVSGIPLVCASIGGLFISVLQTATQIQEQSIGFLVKLLIVAGVLGVVGEWGFAHLLKLFYRSFSMIALLGGQGA